MNEFIEKLISRLEKEEEYQHKKADECEKKEAFEMISVSKSRRKNAQCFDAAIQVVKQLAEEYKTKRKEVISKLLNGEWVNTEDVEEYLGINFKLGWKLFDFSRTAEWNPPPLNGQKITTQFRLKGNNNGWISVSERLPERNKPVLCWVKSTTISSGETFIIGSCDRGFWFLQTYEIGHHHFPVKDYEVIAWQPLPAHYQPKGADDDHSKDE